MRVVIDISQDDFNSIYHGGLYFIGHDRLDECITEAFQTARIIPKGHGDLIDRDKLEKDTEWDEYEDGFISYSHLQIFSEPVVIPTDKGELDNEDSN